MKSARSFRSIFTIREKEDNPELLQLVVKSTDEARNHLNQHGTSIFVDGKNLHLQCDIKGYYEGS